MAFRLRIDEAPDQALRRIATEQVDRAIAEIADSDLSRHDVVHKVRKRCKKIRGLIRLYRPCFRKHYQLENAWYRDAAAELSGFRDARTVVDTFDKLINHFQDQAPERVFEVVRESLSDRLEDVSRMQGSLENDLEQFLEQMHGGRERIADWNLDAKGFKALKRGLGKTYRRGHAALRDVRQHPDNYRFHQWRKRTKYHGYHMRLLRPAWKGPLKARYGECKLLSEYLGDHHDLSVLRQTISEFPEDAGIGETLLDALHVFIQQRQVQLQELALPLGERIYAEKPKHFVKRIGSYWKA